MKINQLRSLVEIKKQGLNMSAAAKTLFTSQPGISRQLKELEQEIGVQIFVRKGKLLTGITQIGEVIIHKAHEALNKLEEITLSGQEFLNDSSGELSIATTHTQARYVLPKFVQSFMRELPQVKLSIHQGTPMEVVKMVVAGDADLGMATEALDSAKKLVLLPCYRWNRCVLAPPGHPLTQVERLTLEELVRYPIITYDSGFTGRGQLDQAFQSCGLHPNIVLSAVDADVIKTYVRLGLGVGIIAKMAYDAKDDAGLQVLNAEHLFGASTTYIALNKDRYIRKYIYRFIEIIAPHLPVEIVNEALVLNSHEERQELFAGFEIPSF